MSPEQHEEVLELRARVAELQAELEATEAETSQPVRVSDLSQGDDEYEIDYRVRYWATGSPRTRKTWLGSILATWNEVFSALGPLMIDEATEADLDEELDRFVVRCIRDLMDEDEEGLLPPDDESSQLTSIEAEPEAFQDVVVQLFSLGLITRSDRRRGVNDLNTYWTLTPTGKNHLMRTRAICRSPSTDEKAEEDFPSDAEE